MTQGFGLSATARLALLQRLSRRKDDKAPATGAARAFRELPGQRDMELIREAAGALGLENPFFRPHEGIAAATSIIGNREVINYGSYNYLGLNGDARVMRAAQAAIDRHGVSASASRMVSGERPVHGALEDALAAHYGVEAALALVSGHATNVTVLGHLMGPRDLILHDAAIHNSCAEGARLSGAKRIAFAHNDWRAAERELAASRRGARRALIVIEGHYSMDGDIPELPRFIEMARRHDAWLMVDEAHGMGVVGATGHGIHEHWGVDAREVDIWMGTLSKTLVGLRRLHRRQCRPGGLAEAFGARLRLFGRHGAGAGGRRAGIAAHPRRRARARRPAAGQYRAVPAAGETGRARYRHLGRARHRAGHRRVLGRRGAAVAGVVRARDQRAADPLSGGAGQFGAAALLPLLRAYGGADPRHHRCRRGGDGRRPAGGTRKLTEKPALRIALLTLESTASAEAAARVLRQTRHDVVFLGLSDAYGDRRATTRRHLARSGTRILPWLFVEFAAPRLWRRGGVGPVGAAAFARGVPATAVAAINSAATQPALAALDVDLIVTCHFDQILTPETIAIARLGGINLHPSLLPLHRGPMPCFWAAADGNNEFGVTVHRLAPRIDAGAILAQRAVSPPPGATVSGTARALHLAGADLLLQVIDEIAEERDRGVEVPLLPYRPFPDREALALAAKRGVRLSGWADFRAARRLGGAVQ